MPLQAQVQADFSAGVNVVTNPYGLRKTQVLTLTNMILDEHGAVRVRDGTLIQGAQSPVPGDPIMKLYDFIRADGTVYKLAITAHSGSGGVKEMYQRDKTPWTLAGTFTVGSETFPPDVVTFTNLMIITDCNDTTYATPRSWDGATFMTLTGAPSGGKHLANHLNYLWLGNTASTTNYTTLVGPSSLQSSAIVNPNSWPAANQTWISPDDGQTITALSLFTIAEAGISPTAALIIFKEYSGYEATGVLGTTTFAVQRIKSDMGCVASRSVQFISGFGLIRLTHRGFALYDGVNDELISEEVRPYLFGRDTITGISQIHIQNSVASQVPNPPLYICGCPMDGQANSVGLTRFFIFDLVRRAWSICTFANVVRSFQLMLDPGALPTLLGGDYTAGYVRRYFAGDTNDDGTAIAWSMLPAPLHGGQPTQRTYLRRLLVDTFGFAAGAQLTVTFTWADQSVPSTKTIPTIASGTSDLTLEFAVLGGVIADWIEATISGTAGPGKIRAIAWHHVPMPLTRSVTTIQQD